MINGLKECPYSFHPLVFCRRAIETVEVEECKMRLNAEENSLPETDAEMSIKRNQIRVMLRHMASVISEVNSSALTNQTELPLHQKLAVCTLLCLVKDQQSKEPTLGQLYDAYLKVCNGRKLKFESEAEFVGVVNMLEVKGVVEMKKMKELRMSKLRLRMNESELSHTLQDRFLMSSILEHGIH